MIYPDTYSSKKVLLCHDWLTGMRGGEKVLEILGNWFPQADICTLICNSTAISETIKRHPVHTSCLQQFPGIFSNYRYLLPLFPSALRSIDVPPADLMISTSHCVAKSLRKPKGARHLSYCFTPMRYAWLFHDEYLGKSALKRIIASPFLACMRHWDRNTTANVDLFVAISRHVADRIRRFYDRDSEIVFPPVDTDRFTPAGAESDFDLIVSALVPYKRIDLAVEAYRKLGRKLKIAGIGGELARLKEAASTNIEFLGWQSDDQILELYRACRLLVFPGEEDFGIVPVEAQSCGKPVVAYRKGGATETVVDGTSGVLFEKQTPECLAEAVEACSSKDWTIESIRQSALRFSTRNFVEGFNSALTKLFSDGPS